MLSLRGGYLGAVVGEGVAAVDDLDANLGVELLQTHLGLAKLHLGAGLVGLGDAVAQRDGEVDADALVGRGAVEEIAEGGAVADGGEASREGRVLRY